MQVGEIVTWKNPPPWVSDGTPDGKIFYKVMGVFAVVLRVKTFYVGRLERARRKGRGLSEVLVDKESLRPTTQEEKGQLVLALFME